MNFIVTEQVRAARDVYRMTLSGDATGITAPGQFVNVSLPGFFLRRPLSVCDFSDQSLTLLYKVVGQGTAAMAAMEPGQALDLLLPLGNGFDVAAVAGQRALLVGGGLGVAPLLGLARYLIDQQADLTAVLGFQSAQDVCLADELRALGVRVLVATVDGSLGTRGFVTDAMAGLTYDAVLACGPEPMLRAVHRLCPVGQFSFEARMACGFGACMGCTCRTNFGAKRICVDGPVLRGEEIAW